MENQHSNAKATQLSVAQYDEAIARLAVTIDTRKYSGLYPIPRGGYRPAIVLSRLTGLPVHTELQAGSLVVDDLIDSGRTLAKYPDHDTAVVYAKNGNTDKATYYGQEIAGWVQFPDESGTTIEENIVRILQHIGEDATRPGLLGTPDRIVRMLGEICRGYDPAQRPKITTFQNGADGLCCDQMITDTGSFYSLCEHHFMPFFGRYWFAYIPHPDGRILGLSKIARVVDYHAARLQVQERLVSDILEDIRAALGDEHPPLGMALIMEAEHLCKSMRGVKKQGKMTASMFLGCFKDSISTRAEFMQVVTNS